VFGLVGLRKYFSKMAGGGKKFKNKFWQQHLISLLISL